jgi:hypothetical protein
VIAAVLGGRSVLRAMRQKHGPVAFEAIVMPVLQEVGAAGADPVGAA